MNNLPAILKVKELVKTDEMKARFSELLQDRAVSYMASIINVVSNSSSLQKCDPNSIMSAALIAASFNLPIDSNLGYAAIVPYGSKAQFQIMWKGLVQLAIRTAQYKRINTSEVYYDEFKGYNPFTGEVSFFENHIGECYRDIGKTDQIIGYYSYFELVNGFYHELYMTTTQIDNHGKKYSKAYQADIKDKTRHSMWTTDFPVMAKKTVLKLLLSRWGILSIEMEKALSEDQKVQYPSGGEYEDNPKNNSNAKDKEFEESLKNHNIETEGGEISASEILEIILEKLKEKKYPADKFWKDRGIEDPALLDISTLSGIFDSLVE